MSKQLIWVYKDGRTNPGTVHRFTSAGQPNAVVIHVLREQSVDADHKGGDAVEDVVMTAPPNSKAVTHLPPNWRNEVWWGPDNEYMGPGGLLYVYDEEYPDPHAELALAETSRTGHKSTPEAVQPVEPVTPESNQPPGPPEKAKPEPEPVHEKPKKKNHGGKAE